jgi:tRNA-specific 2-thiouridylase
VRGTDFHDHLNAPRGSGRLAGWPHAGAAGGAACGDLVRLAVRVEGERVVEAGFSASGCGATTAAASAAVELVEGAPFLDAARVTADDLSNALGGLVPPKRHAAELAADALHRALGAAARDGAPALAPSSDRTLVAMSGGVDSAVAARLALDEGHEVVAVTLELWADPANDGERSCCSPQAVTGARALAHRMGLPHVTLDLREPFRREVVDDFVSEHAAGRTPNPCVRCNGLVRFDAMLELADRLGAARLATGHYARIDDDGEGPLLRAAADPLKDQTYMLARLDADQLARLWFPLGELEKPRVRELARAAGLSVAEKPESQDLCFLAGTRRSDFLIRHAADPMPEEPGEIVDLRGRLLGSHRGQQAFTVGQRRGIGVAAEEPLYVLHKDPRSGRVLVGPRRELATSTVGLSGATLLRPGDAVDRVKLRYRSDPIACSVEGDPAAGSHERLILSLDEPVDGAAPGQTACLMRGQSVVGWATIREPEEPPAAVAGARLEAVDAA